MNDAYPDLGFGDNYHSSEYVMDDSRYDMYGQSNRDYKDHELLKRQIANNEKGQEATIHNFESYPAVVHFSEWTLTDGCKQIIRVTNTSKKSLRFQIYPPVSSEFSTQYDKIGNLAPGMSQTITVKFSALEYKYYYDCLRIQGEDSSLLIPLHAYPIANKVFFPKQLLFGPVSLCESSTKKISLSCSIPVNFSFEMKILQPHPFYIVEPTRGIIPANGSVDVKITFNPLNLGTCIFKIQLIIGQFGFLPLDCEVSARAVSGVIQSKELLKAEKRVMQHILNSGNLLSKSLGGETSTFRGDLEPSSNHLIGRKESRFLDSTILRKVPTKSHQDDPVAMMLAHTFKAMDLNSSLDNAVNGKFLLGSKVLPKNMDGTYSGVRAIDGLLKATLPVIPKGPGSGLVFDAGAQWMSNQTSINHKKKIVQRKKKGDVNTTSEASEDLVLGLRIPFQLDTVQSVSFVLTQEAGKLKPKDLKIAIDRNRAERELRAEEQERIREQGGGSGMDLKGIIAEDKLNSDSCGDPFKRQLREMAFLADVDDVRKQELEKEFRVSEEFSGAIPLTESEIQEILHQRKMLAMRKKRTEWKETQSMQHTLSFAPSHADMKAGTSVAVLMQALSSLTPSFDVNRNDIWSKRMNTLRYFISMVSRWIVRRRAGIRLAKIKAKLSSVMAVENGIEQLNQMSGALPACPANSKVLNKAQRSARKELVRAWIDDENSSNRLAATSATVGVGAPPLTSLGGRRPPSENSSVAFDQCSSVAELVCAADHEAAVRRQRSELVTTTLRFDMASQPAVQRILFPKCFLEEGNALQHLKSPGIETIKQFDDRQLFQLKIRPEYTAMRYTQHKIPEVPIFYPTGKDKVMRIGAPEEHSLRPSADLNVGLEAILSNLSPEPPGIVSMRSAIVGAAASALLDLPQLDIEANRKNQYAAPPWLLGGDYGDEWTAPELDFFKVCSDLRSYHTPSLLVETDADWILRPLAPEDSLVYKDDESTRSSLLRMSGFSSVNTYLLGGLESRWTPATDGIDLPPYGPTLSDVHMADLDRHRSGLHCLGRDHHRLLTGQDLDLTPLQRRQAKVDHLTDSESDEENKYDAPVPSMRRVRALLKGKSLKAVSILAAPENPIAVKKGKAVAKGAKEAKSMVAVSIPVAVPYKDLDDDDSEGEVDESKSEQVELMRDRKTLELESSQSRLRQGQARRHTDRLAILSQASQCLMQALPMQTTFHSYQSIVLTSIERNSVLPLNCFVETYDKSK